MKYSRVIPRDFFNESKLLKCIGHLSIKILDCELPEGVKIEIEESFEIELLEDGHLHIVNYPVTVNDQQVIMKTVYNSKSAFPFICEFEYNEVEVFTDKGEFAPEFIEFAHSF